MTLCLAAAAALGEAPVAPTPDDAAALAALNDPSYAVREAMTHTLLTDDAMDLDRLRALYAGATTPEQRQRVLCVARHHAIRQIVQQTEAAPDAAPAAQARGGALGVTQLTLTSENNAAGEAAPGAAGENASGGGGGGGVMVLDTLPGFPAYTALQVDDIILEVNGVALLNDKSHLPFRDQIQAIPAGHAVTLTVLRNGERLPIDVTLASQPALAAIYASTAPATAPQVTGFWLMWRFAVTQPNSMTKLTPPVIVRPSPNLTPVKP